LKEKGAGDIPVIAGGIIPEKDVPRMKKVGIREIFLPGTSTQDIVGWIREHIEKGKKIAKTP
jgi:methylmalonyl-CoA mutase C-terminal domain/subunit